MFEIKMNGIYKVKYARSGKKQDGSGYGLITMVESENQPEELERKSNSRATVKMWFDELPEGITDGCSIRLMNFDGFQWKHSKNNYNGREFFEDVVEIINPVVLKES